MNKIKNLLTRQYTLSETVGIVLFIVAIGFFMDFISGRFSFFLVLLATGCLIIGFKQLKAKNTSIGSLLMLIGTGLFVHSFITSTAFRLLIVIFLIYNGAQIFRSSKEKASVKLAQKENPFPDIPLIESTPFFKNKLIGQYRNINAEYALEDINIQTGFGDVFIDITDKLIPVGETVILIRGGVGSIFLNIPSDVGVCIHMSSLIGKMKLMNQTKTAFNLTSTYQSPNYKDENRRIKIVTSLIIGDMEVKRS